jgi:hypothetical protein
MSTGIPDSLRNGYLVREERQINEHQSPAGSASHSSSMVDHLVERGAQSRLVPCQHLVERVTNQQYIDVGLFEQPCKRRVVTGKHDDATACCLHRGEVEDGQGTRFSAHASSAQPALAARSLGWTAQDGE